MEIGDATTRKSAPLMSAFPRETRAFTEPINATSDVVIGPGKTMPDLIRIYYPGTIPTNLQGNFPFLDRDNKERHYAPGVEDKFVFKNEGGLTMFRDTTKLLIKNLCDSWESLGFPLVYDEDRKVDLPDLEIAWKALEVKHPLHQRLLSNRDALMFIMANVDILKKASIVRTVNPGWWAVSYKGKASTDPSFFSTSITAHKRAFTKIISSPRFKSILDALNAEAGDPITTNPGYPFFAAIVDTNGNPVTRIRTVELFKNTGNLKISDWKSTLSAIDDRGGKFGMPGHPLAVGPLRRQSAGRKFQHQFTTTPSGLVTAFDEKGVNSQRVAWMVPYIYNVYMSPLQIVLKAFRKILPGLYHDGDSKRARHKTLISMHKRNALFIAEADYSNYDRFIPVDIIRSLLTHITDATKQPKYWMDGAMHLHDQASLVWPDFSTISEGNGWLFKPGLLGLMSGVKVTSEIGTLVNSVINAEVLARLRGWNATQLESYLTQYMAESVPLGSLTEPYSVQSDDTLLIYSNPSDLFKAGELFKTAVKAAGLKGSVDFGDRFLMRHMQGGSDRPVPARVFQNTISNESPPEHELVFLAGLASRTDGLCGYKTVDPFNTGKHQPITVAEASFTKLLLTNLARFISTASIKSKVALDLLDLLQSSLPAQEALDKEAKGKYIKAAPGNFHTIDRIRKEITRALADYELAQMKKSGLNSALTSSWLYQLYKDRNIPSQGMLLDSLAAMDSSIAPTIAKFGDKEHQFYLYAMDKLAVPTSILK